MDDEELSRFYDQPENREPAGPMQRRNRKPLTSNVPVRFSPDVIEQVKRLADDDGRTVSSWIRAAVNAELRRRQRDGVHVALSVSPATWTVCSSGVER